MAQIITNSYNYFYKTTNYQNILFFGGYFFRLLYLLEKWYAQDSAALLTTSNKDATDFHKHRTYDFFWCNF